MKIVLNQNHIPFTLSAKAEKWLRSHDRDDDDWDRTDPLLVQCIEELGEDASGIMYGAKCKLAVVDWDETYDVYMYVSDYQESLRPLYELTVYKARLP